jgi:hypothetical protein
MSYWFEDDAGFHLIASRQLGTYMAAIFTIFLETKASFRRLLVTGVM